MLLYHSFPRGVEKGSRANQQGIVQLAMMMEHGLLMTPEDLVIPQNRRAVNRESPKTKFRQTRACFTLATREELWRRDRRRASRGELESHSALFGEFAIGLDPVRARLLGAVPVIYFYSDPSDTNLTHEILFYLRELRSLVIALARLEAKAAIPERDTLDAAALDAVGYLLEGDPVVEKRIGKVSASAARAAVDLLDTDRLPAWNLVDWIDATLDLFQTADSRTTLGSLAYYQQREWRIVRLFAPHLRCYRLSSDHTLDGIAAMDRADQIQLRERLQYLNRDFFTDERLDDSAILIGTDRKPFFDFVQEIICPSTVALTVADLFESAGIGQCFGQLRTVHGGATIFSRKSE